MPNPCLPLSRRQFGLSLCGLPLALSADEFSEFAAMPWNGPANVARVYLGGSVTHWPKPNLDLAREIASIEPEIAAVGRKNAHLVRFTGGELLKSAEEVRPWLDKQKDLDGVLMIPISLPTPAMRALIDALNVPGLFFSRPYATHGWASIADLRKQGRALDVVATTSYGDLDPYLRIFRTAHHLRHSKVLVGTANASARQPAAEAYRKKFGTDFRIVSGNEFKEAFNAADDKLATQAAAEFTRNALKVVEPSPKEIHDGIRFYYGLKNMLKQERANALTIDCFGTLAAKTLPGYPCIAWSKFNDAGLYGVCEADLASAWTQMLITSYTGVPGFVSDPVFDISRNEVIHAHCVSATKMKGPDAPASPYIIRRHLETDEGAVLQVLMPSGEPITVARFTEPGRMLISTAEVTGSGDSDRGCRSQIRTRVADAEKWLQNYTAGLHRVIFYGDHVRAIERMGRLLNFAVVHEM
jgi:L-fucose isomerase-like protein